MTPYLLLFIFVLSVSTLLSVPGVHQKPAWLFVWLVLVLFAGLRNVGVDRDSYNYFYAYYLEAKHFADYLSGMRMVGEPAAVLLASFVKYGLSSGFSLFLLIFALIGVGLKLLCIRKVSPFPALSIALYLGSYYLIQEMTQIRAGVATGFGLLSMYQLSRGNRRGAVFFSLLATAFHFSALAFLPVALLFSNDRLNRRGYLALLLIGAATTFLHFNFVRLIVSVLFARLDPRISTYVQMSPTQHVEVLNPVFWMKAVICAVAVVKIENLKKRWPISVILVKCYCMSFFAFGLLSAIPAAALRLRELFGVVDILLIPMVVAAFREKMLVRLGLVAFAIVSFLLYIFYVRLFEPYQVFSLG